MTKVIKIKDVLGTELRSRILAEKLYNLVSFDSVLDFADTGFMSRSFAGELYNLRLQFLGLGFQNMPLEARRMFTIVTTSRQHGAERHRRIANKVEIINLRTPDEMREYFSKI